MECALFVPAVRCTKWLSEVLPGTSPAALPVAGRRLVDYQLECAQNGGVSICEVLDWLYSEALEADFADLTRTGRPVFYVRALGDVPSGLRDIEGYESPLTADVSDGLVVAWGLVLPVRMPSFAGAEAVPEAELADTPPGLYRREGGRWTRLRADCMVVGDVRSWHALNFAVLRFPGAFTLPGYRSERGVHLGRNVVMERGAEAKRPVLLCDNTWLARNVRLEGSVIVGSGSFIGEGATLARTIVCDDTYVGMGLDIRDKIVAGGRVIDPKTGAWADINEPGLARRIAFVPGWLRRAWHFIRGRSHGRRG